MSAQSASAPVLRVEDLGMYYETRSGDVKAVDGVSFDVGRGESVGLVGESGCGKSSIAMTLLKLLPENGRIVGGKILLDGTDLAPLSEDEMRTHRWNRIAMVFQAAMNSFNPVYTVGDQIIEALETHIETSPDVSMERVRELFELVSLDPGFIGRYPHEYSGGMKQRAGIAMALACEPDLLIADEPTTALDVIVQDRILKELREVQQALNMSLIYISHDMAVIAEVSHTVGVMYAGRIVEWGETVDIFRNPMHPYTQTLMSSFPSVTGPKHELAMLGGEPPNLQNPPAGCRFHPRCPYATDVCKSEKPPKVEGSDTHWAACWHPLEA